MEWMVELIREYGFGIVFLNVLIEQMGAPIPAYPVLVVTGALDGTSLARLGLLIVVAVVAALIADVLWVRAGKAYGHRVLGRICRIWPSPDACIRCCHRCQTLAARRLSECAPAGRRPVCLGSCWATG